MKKLTSAAKVDTIGLDLGDDDSVLCGLDSRANVVRRDRLNMTQGSVTAWANRQPKCRVVMEAGTHSRWVSEIVKSAGHEVFVGNPRSLALIYKAQDKSDTNDAERLARLGKADPQLLSPIQHRGVQAQTDLAYIKARDAVVRARTLFVNTVRGLVKSHGARIKTCSAASFHNHIGELPESLRQSVAPLMFECGQLTARIREYDKKIRQVAEESYPETERIKAISGVGSLIALAFVLTLENPQRFKNGRAVGAYVGLVPRKDQSGRQDKQLRITKAGDGHLRRLLVTASQYILRTSSVDCDLKRFGMKLAARGGKNAKKRAVVAVARKLSAVMFRLWRTHTPYDPDHKLKQDAVLQPTGETYMGEPKLDVSAA